MSGQQLQKTEGIDLLRQKLGNHMIDTPSMSSLSVDEALPCLYIPFPPNPLFYGRGNILDHMTASLEKTPVTRPLRSVALWAPAGMGKTQIALQYAWKQRDEGVNAIFWIDTENESEWTKAFTEIAGLLGLEGATSSKGHETNRLLVLRWLQETSW